ncbi:MAG TPA: DinB family protein [Kineosporiaceae bacterium]|nr:DinB family protein [Kineosporiaceae bacterium]
MNIDEPLPFAEPGQNLAEGPMLAGWLATYRQALRRKCHGLGENQLRATPVPPSNLSLLGLVRHLTEMERVHLVHAIPRTPIEFVYYTPEDPEHDFDGVQNADPVADLRRWQQEQDRADAVITPYLAANLPTHVRFRLVKVIGEYARHAGHADLIRERLDGVTGE